MAVTPIAATQLREEYAALTVAGTLAGSGKLYQFERMCWEILAHGEGAAKPVAFSLAAIFEFLARRQDGEPVTHEEAQFVYSIFDQQIVACLDFLSGRDALADPLRLVSEIAIAYDRFRRVS
jgi:hypothetical protein